MVRRVAVDASVALSWVLPEESFQSTSQLREHAVAQDLALLVPPTFWYEVSNVLWVAVGRGRLERNTAMAGLETLLDFRFETCTPHPLDCLSLALSAGITAYDAAYLQVALEHGTALWTVDGGLRKAARQAGVPVEPLLSG